MTRRDFTERLSGESGPSGADRPGDLPFRAPADTAFGPLQTPFVSTTTHAGRAAAALAFVGLIGVPIWFAFDNRNEVIPTPADDESAGPVVASTVGDDPSGDDPSGDDRGDEDAEATSGDSTTSTWSTSTSFSSTTRPATSESSSTSRTTASRSTSDPARPTSSSTSDPAKPTTSGRTGSSTRSPSTTDGATTTARPDTAAPATTKRPTPTERSTSTGRPTTATRPSTTRRPTTTRRPPTTVALPTGNLVSNGSFESPRIPDGEYDQTSVSGWSSSEGSIELWGTGHNGVNSAAGRQHMEVNGNSAARIRQTVNVVPGVTYRWSLRHRGREDTDSLEVWIDGARQRTVRSGVGGWSTHSGTVDVRGSTDQITIELRALDAGAIGNLVDDVQLVAVGAIETSG